MDLQKLSTQQHTGTSHYLSYGIARLVHFLGNEVTSCHRVTDESLGSFQRGLLQRQGETHSQPLSNHRSPDRAKHNRKGNRGVCETVLDVISTEDGAKWVRNLQGDDAKLCIDVLDEIIAEGDLSDSQLKTILDILTQLCVRVRSIPTSCILPARGLAKVGPYSMTNGTYADVWRGRYRHQLVAIKAFRVSESDDMSEVSEAFAHEIALWRHLRHPNILPFIGINTTLFRFCAVSPWMAHGNIGEYLRKRPDVDRFNLLIDAASGLAYLHDMGIVDGDLKIANILVDDDEHARLADFGLADTMRTLASGHHITTSDKRAGTAHTVAPELYDPEIYGCESAAPTRQSDVYAFSMVTYECFTSRSPFSGRTQSQILYDVIAGKRPERPCDSSILGLSDSVWKLMQMCWHQHWSQRPDISTILQWLIHEQQVQPPQTPNVSRQDQPACRYSQFSFYLVNNHDLNAPSFSTMPSLDILNTEQHLVLPHIG